jgi:hypothetical protein
VRGERRLVSVTGHRDARSVRRYAQLGDEATVAAFPPRTWLRISPLAQ